MLTPVAVFGILLAAAADDSIQINSTADEVLIETDAIKASVRKRGYVSGVAAGSFIDKKTGAHDLGFGLHIMDFLLAPGWRDDGYLRDARFHGNLPKHYVEGPQICTQAKELPVEVIRGRNFVALRMKYRFHKPAKGMKAGSTWTQTLVFQPGVRYFIGAEEIESVNDVDDLFYRLDMPGHIKHNRGDVFSEVYLSYSGLIPQSQFHGDFPPDAKFLYRRRDDRIPERMIRAYHVRNGAGPSPWIAGMTLDPAACSEAWCHQRGYVCMIAEFHKRRVKAGEKFGAVHIVGYFDDVAEMQKVYDANKGENRLVVDAEGFKLTK